MREIKFRFWAKDKKKMFYPFDATGNILHIFIRSDGKICEITDEYLVDDIKYLYVPLQYTGLKDKNGKEIYEGDIVQVESDRPGKTQKLVIAWNDLMVRFDLWWGKHKWVSQSFNEALGMDYNYSYEIIGNIYENPELIK